MDLFSNRTYHEHLLRETKVMQYYTFISEARDLLIPSNAGNFRGWAYVYVHTEEFKESYTVDSGVTIESLT